MLKICETIDFIIKSGCPCEKNKTCDPTPQPRSA